jgi:hypothetical protein
MKRATHYLSLRVVRSEDAALGKHQYDFLQSRARRSLMTESQMRILGTDRQIRHAIELLYPDNESAKEYAGQVVDGYDIELWQGDRKSRRSSIRMSKANSAV